MSEHDDDLLHIVSAWQEMSWQSFRKAFDALHARVAPAGSADTEAVSRLRWRVLRLLDWLGHADVSAREGTERIYAAPPVLARLPVTGFPQAVLCGARSPRTTEILQAACQKYGCRLDLSRQMRDGDGAHVPVCAAVHAEDEEATTRVAQEIRVGYPPAPPAWRLLQFSGSLEEYLQSRPQVQEPDLNWPRRDFDVTALQFRAREGAAPDVRLSVYEHPLRPARLCYLWCGDRRREVDRDWGRYALLRHAGVEVLAYDPQRFTLVVPSGAPLPRFLARACVLCSGYAPPFVQREEITLPSPERVGFYVFRGVPPVVAKTVGEKLRQRLTITALQTPPAE